MNKFQTLVIIMYWENSQKIWEKKIIYFGRPVITVWDIKKKGAQKIEGRSKIVAWC